MACAHLVFDAAVQVNRVQEGDPQSDGPVIAFTVDVTVSCHACGKPFRFIGLQAGMSYVQPMVSVDGLELRAPVAPVDEQTAVEAGAFGGVTGFGVQMRGSH